MAHAYRLFETSVFSEDLERLNPGLQRRLKDKLRGYVYPQLKAQPYFGPNIKKLRDWKPETWRYRIGPWRLFYEVHENERTVHLVTLDWRKDSY